MQQYFSDDPFSMFIMFKVFYITVTYYAINFI